MAALRSIRQWTGRLPLAAPVGQAVVVAAVRVDQAPARAAVGQAQVVLLARRVVLRAGRQVLALQLHDLRQQGLPSPR
jgi:hypothetical protein